MFIMCALQQLMVDTQAGGLPHLVSTTLHMCMYVTFLLLCKSDEDLRVGVHRQVLSVARPVHARGCELNNFDGVHM